MSCPKCASQVFTPIGSLAALLDGNAIWVQCANDKCNHPYWSDQPSADANDEERPHYDNCPTCKASVYRCGDGAEMDMWNGKPREVQCVECKLYYFHSPKTH